MFDKKFVLLTAIPPTTGHRDLIQFASRFDEKQRTVVVLCTQPDEPLVETRAYVIERICRQENVAFKLINRTMPQNDSEYSRFWEMWRDLLHELGATKYSAIIASETYGAKLAESIQGTFIPFDIERKRNKTKAELIRNEPILWWESILPEIQSILGMRITMFGAESVGKSTITRLLHLSSHQVGEIFDARFEYARPYLEQVGEELTKEKMAVIWEGQLALQRMPSPSPIIVQDTDLFSTVGYWDMHKTKFGEVPRGLVTDAFSFKSDLYYVLPSSAPFFPDKLRYGGDRRESSDQYWIDLLEKYDLPFEVVPSGSVQSCYDYVQESALRAFKTSPVVKSLMEHQRA